MVTMQPASCTRQRWLLCQGEWPWCRPYACIGKDWLTLYSATAPVLGAVGSILGWALNQLGPDMQRLGCPQLAKFDNTLFNQFPGAK